MTDDAPPSADAARARFAAATDAHLRAPVGEVTIRHVDQKTVMTEADRLWGEDPRPSARMQAVYSAEESRRIAELNAVMGEPLAHRLLLEHDGAVVGSFWGMQDTWGRYYMVNTVMTPAWQRRGVYRALLPRVIEAARDAGFQEVYSRHRADNNAILIPKLKAGFAIAAFEVAPRFGMLIHLRLYLIEALRKLYQHRIDSAHGDELRGSGVLPR